MIAAVLFALAAGCWTAPVDGPIVDHFREPACPYCPGNRGLEYAPAYGSAVRAVHGGNVTFAGSVAGTRYVVIDHGDGMRASYGKLSSISVRRGASVSTGQMVGRSTSALFFGLRIGDTYIDPEPRLGVVEPRPHLVPLDGARRRPGRPPRVTCRAAGEGRWRQPGTPIASPRPSHRGHPNTNRVEPTLRSPPGAQVRHANNRRRRTRSWL